jgi:hypothetical protein
MRVFGGITGVFLALPDGSLWRWGQPGGANFPNLPRAMVPQQVGTNCDWVEARPANGQCVALRKDGTWWHWGVDFAARPVSSTPISNVILSPRQLGDATDWVSVVTGDQHSTGLKKDGTVWAWGHDELGQMGNGLGFKETNVIGIGQFRLHLIQTNLVQVGTNRDWIALGGVGSETLGLRAEGTLWVWGKINWFANHQPGAIFPVPTQICCETNWVAIEQDSALDREGRLWRLFRAPPDATASASDTCLLIASNCVAGRVALAIPGVYQLHADGTLWLTELMWHEAPESQFTMSGKARRVGRRSDWVSLWLTGTGTAVGLTADGTVWMWGTDLGQEGTMPLNLRMSLFEERIMSAMGSPPAKPHSPGWITPIQRTPRPIMKILSAASDQSVESKGLVK